MTESCSFCRLDKEIVLKDGEVGYCIDCLSLSRPRVKDALIEEFLVKTIPYRVGDKVECRTAGLWLDGRGEVTGVDTTLQHGGTPVYPTFNVKITDPVNDDSPTEAWYTEVCLRRVG